MRKTFALFSLERIKTCDHAAGFSYQGRVPGTGPQICNMCGANILDICRECPLALHEHAVDAVDHAFVPGRTQ